MSNEKRTVRVQVVMTPSEVEEIDDWGFAHRIRSRSDVFRKLVLAGLDALRKAEAANPSTTRPAKPAPAP